MIRDPESVIVLADMSAFEYHEAAWAADEREAAPPDLSTLSDRALFAVRQYEARHLLPPRAGPAVETEYRRRGLVQGTMESRAMLAAIFPIGVAGLVIGWLLFFA